MSRTELGRFEDFIRSPYHTKIKNVVRLFEYLKSYHPEFTQKEVDREFVWEKIFPDKEYNYGIMKNLIHGFGKVCEEFISIEHYKKNKFRTFYELSEAMYEKNIHKTLSYRFNSLEKIVEKYFLKGDASRIEEEYFIMSNIYSLKLYIELEMTRAKKTNTKDTRNAASEYMIYSFIIYMYKLLCNVNVAKEYDKDPEKTTLLDQFLSVIGDDGMQLLIETARKRSLLHFHTMNCYYRMYKCIGREVSNENYFEFKKALFESEDYIKGRYAFDLSVNLWNALIYLKNIDNKCQETLDLFDYRIKNKILVEEGQRLPDFMFITYIVNAFVLDKQDEIEKFKSEFLHLIPSDRYKLCLLTYTACIEYLKKNYNLSIEALSKCSSDLPLIKIILKDLKIMSLYELNDYESLLYEIDSYKHMVKYKNNPEMLKNYNYEFCVIVKKLMDLKKKFDIAELRKIDDQTFTFMKTTQHWLRIKINELKEKRMKNNLK